MLELKNIYFQASDRNILNNISLTINDGRFVVITGPNGSGKTTLARLIMGIERPSSGQIILNGQDITGLNITERARLGLSFAFQQPVRFKGLTVTDIISLAAGTDKKLTTAQVCEYLSEVGLCARDYVNREVDGKLSGGELKRIEIAGLLARGEQTKLAIFDEPEAGIDLWSFNNLIDVFNNLRQNSAAGIVVISHQERILSIADELVLLSGGQIVSQGTRAEILPQLINIDYKYSCKGGQRND